jgi:ribonuclease P protein component
MLPKPSRLTREEFDTFFPQTRPVSGSYLSLRYAKGDAEKGSRCAVVTSKKKIKSAHDRNRARRRVYGALGELVLPEGIYIFTASPAVLAIPYKDLLEDIKTLLAKTGASRSSAQ